MFVQKWFGVWSLGFFFHSDLVSSLLFLGELVLSCDGFV